MRHMSQESILFLRKLQKPDPEPFELRRQALQVGRPADRDGPGKGAAAELADGSVDGPDRPAEQVGEHADDGEGHRHQEERAPEKILLRELGRLLQGGEIMVDLAADAARDPGRAVRHLRVGAHQIAHARRVRRRRLDLRPRMLGVALEGVQIGLRLRVERQGEKLVEGVFEQPVVARVGLQELVVRQDLVEPRGALERGDLDEHALIVARALHAAHHQLLAAARHAVHLHGGIHDREQQRRRDDREADQHEAAQ